MKIDKKLLPPNNLKPQIQKFVKKHHIRLEDFSKKVDISPRSLYRKNYQVVFLEEATYYHSLEHILNCNLIDLYFSTGQQVLDYEINILVEIKALIIKSSAYLPKKYYSQGEFINEFYKQNTIFGFEIFELLRNLFQPRLLGSEVVNSLIKNKLNHLIYTSVTDKYNVKRYQTNLLIDFISFMISQYVSFFEKISTSLEAKADERYIFLSKTECFKRCQNFLFKKEEFINSSKRLASIFSQMALHDINYWFIKLDEL